MTETLQGVGLGAGALWCNAAMSSPERASIRLAAVSLDAVDPLPVAEFWRDLLGLQTIGQNEDFVALRGAQPSPARWRVLIDPAGHPFCISNQMPEP